MEKDLRIPLGQRLAVGFDGYTIPEEYRQLIRQYKIGNVLLFRRNVRDFDQLRALCDDLRQLILEETGLPPFIMIDEECGSVSRLSNLVGQTPSAMAIGATGDPENAYRIGRIIGDELRSVGVNFDLAPVLDCFTNPDNTVVGNRSFGRDPQQVARFGVRYMQGIQESGVLACGKHFPGHGDTAVDSHLDLPIVDKPLDQVRQTELVSFSAAIQAGIEAIMSAHVVFPDIEPDRVPATVSRRVMTGLLRQEMGFDGLIISDGMEMNAVMKLFGIEEGTLRALQAGVDIALVCHSAQQAASVSRRLAQAAADGQLDREEIAAHARRIAARKARLQPSAPDAGLCGNPAQRAVSRSIMAQAIRVLSAPEGRTLPPVDGHALFLGVPAQTVSMANDHVPLDAASLCAEAFGAARLDLTAPDPASAGTAVVILGPHPQLAAATEKALRLHAAGAQVIAVSMSTPRCLDALPDSIWKIGAWQYDRLAADALIQFLGGSGA